MRRRLGGALGALTPLRVLAGGLTVLAACAGHYAWRRKYADYPL